MKDAMRDSSEKHIARIAGFFVAGLVGLLLFIAVAHFVPVFLRFSQGPYGDLLLLPTAMVFIIAASRMRPYFRHRTGSHRSLQSK